MSISGKVAATSQANANKGSKQYDNERIAVKLMKARRKNENAFPDKDIESLVEMSLKVVAKNFHLYPELDGITIENDPH